MNKYYRTLVVAFGFTSLIGCQTMNGDGLFQSHHSDDAITTSIHQEMLHDTSLAATKIQIETMHGAVMLGGHVKTIRQSDTAEAIAKHTPGVKSVQNDIVVRK